MHHRYLSLASELLFWYSLFYFGLALFKTYWGGRSLATGLDENAFPCDANN